MQWYEILVIIACVLIVGGVITKSLIDRKKGKNSCGCDCANCSYCSKRKIKENSEKDANE